MRLRRQASLRRAAATCAVIVTAVAGGGVAVAVGGPGDAVGAAVASDSVAGDAFVTGTFTMHGVITAAAGVRGERRGDRVLRVWQIRGVGCGVSDCSGLLVVRNRGRVAGSRILLRRTGTGQYAGRGTFDVALRCLGRTDRLGSRVPYTITLQVTGRALVGSAWYATRVRATYLNVRRTDATRCPIGDVHDAARYLGLLSSPLPAPPTTTTTTTTTSSTTLPLPLPLPLRRAARHSGSQARRSSASAGRPQAG